jgi:chemotaxis protein CheX
MTETETGALALPATLDMQAAAPLKAMLLARMGGDVMLDASAVERLGAQCLQILLAARRSWDAAGRNFEIAMMSDGFSAALAGFGVAASQLNTGNGVRA